MRITKISVKGLFGMFDHEIPLNQESRITIVHGPNGVGKTVFFSMIFGLFELEGGLFVKTPFNQLQVGFQGGALLTIDNEVEDEYFNFSYSNGEDSNRQTFIVSQFESDDLEQMEFPHHWVNLIRSDKQPEWFQVVRNKTSLDMIHTMRLRRSLFDAYGLHSLEQGDIESNHDALKPTVSKFSETFLEEIFSHSYLANCLEVFYILEELAKEEDYRLAGLGIDEDDEKLGSWLLDRRQQVRDKRREILCEFQGERNAQELILFLDIMNERCLFKSLIIRNATIKFVADNGSEIPFSELSSGEQHLLTLYYKLLFETEPDTLVMIDEPELSMNVVWQRNFLKDLQRIIELRKFDVLIATHSPQIIHDKWDWMVPLGERVDGLDDETG